MKVDSVLSYILESIYLVFYGFIRRSVMYGRGQLFTICESRRQIWHHVALLITHLEGYHSTLS